MILTIFKLLLASSIVSQTDGQGFSLFSQFAISQSERMARVVPIVGPTGRQYVCEADAVISFSPTGALLWRVSIPGEIVGCDIDREGTLYFIDDDGGLEAISPTGKKEWSFQIQGRGGMISLAAAERGGAWIIIAYSDDRGRRTDEAVKVVNGSVVKSGGNVPIGSQLYRGSDNRIFFVIPRDQRGNRRIFELEN